MFFRMIYKSGQIFLPFCHNTRMWQTNRQTDRQTDGRTDRRTDGQTEFSSLDRVCISCSAVKTQKAAKSFAALASPQPEHWRT